MQKFARILAITFLALFAASSVVHVVSANAMSLEMALASDGAMPMPDCEGCAPDGDASDMGNPCDLDCTTPGVATFGDTAEPFLAALPLSQGRQLGVDLPLGRLSAPDPFPPRTLI